MSADKLDRLKAVEAAQYLRVSRSTLAKWRKSGEGPPHHHCGPRLIIYYRQEIDAWLVACDAADRPLSVKAR
ncbi:MAG: helix-turn-helix domain-containing protein [Armatimonadetes bacterium]|nr:helix-turn-helix domain-containing protein [Armatimonadota bacterium]